MSDILPANKITSIEQVPDFLRLRFESGDVPMDAPPGFEEAYYAAWKRVGGQVKAKPPVTMDDL